MNETLQTIMALGILVSAFGGVLLLGGWKLRRAARAVLKDLQRQGALSPEQAVALPYVRQNFLRVGLRDYRPRALKSLVQSGVVGVTPQGAFFLLRPEVLDKL